MALLGEPLPERDQTAPAHSLGSDGAAGIAPASLARRFTKERVEETLFARRPGMVTDLAVAFLDTV